jgi:hypothetical protein
MAEGLRLVRGPAAICLPGLVSAGVAESAAKLTGRSVRRGGWEAAPAGTAGEQGRQDWARRWGTSG